MLSYCFCLFKLKDKSCPLILSQSKGVEWAQTFETKLSLRLHDDGTSQVAFQSHSKAKRCLLSNWRGKKYDTKLRHFRWWCDLLTWHSFNWEAQHNSKCIQSKLEMKIVVSAALIVIKLTNCSAAHSSVSLSVWRLVFAFHLVVEVWSKKHFLMKHNCVVQG